MQAQHYRQSNSRMLCNSIRFVSGTVPIKSSMAWLTREISLQLTVNKQTLVCFCNTKARWCHNWVHSIYEPLSILSLDVSPNHCGWTLKAVTGHISLGSTHTWAMQHCMLSTLERYHAILLWQHSWMLCIRITTWPSSLVVQTVLVMHHLVFKWR